MSGQAACDLDMPPYAQSLGMHVESIEDGLPLIACDAGDLVLGRPGFWHGGVIGGLLEIAAHTTIRSVLGVETRRIRTVNITVQFMRSAPAGRAYAIATIERAGRRLVNLTAAAWQEDRSRHIASAQMTVLLEPEG